MEYNPPEVLSTRIISSLEYAAYRQGDYKDESTQKFQDLYTNIPDCWEVKVKTQAQNGNAPFWTLQILVENTTREVVGYTFMNGFNSTKLPITPITTFVPNGLGAQATATTPVPTAQNGQNVNVAVRHVNCLSLNMSSILLEQHFRIFMN